MASVINGINVYPSGLTITSDGDARTASSVNVPISGLADRTTWLRNITDIRSLTDNRFSALSQVRSAAFDSRFQVTYLLSSPTSTPKLSAVLQPGNAPIDVLGGVAQAGDGTGIGLTSAIAIDPSTGNVVCVSGNRYGYHYSPSTNTATRVDIGSTAIGSGGLTDVVFDPTTGRFIACGYSAAGVPQTRISTNGTTWTAGGSIAGALGTGSALRLVTNRTGVVFAIRTNTAGASVAIYKSTDGGSNWAGSLTAITSTALTTGHLPRVSYSADTGQFFLTLTPYGAGTGCEVWASSDTITWTRIVRLANTALSRIVTMGPTLVSTAAIGATVAGGVLTYTAYSQDAGLTWKLGGAVISVASSSTVFQGDGCHLYVAEDTVDASSGLYWSGRFASPTAPGLT